MKKGLYAGIFTVFMCFLLFLTCVSTPEEPEPTEAPTEAPEEEKPTPEPTEKPTEEPTEEPTQIPEPTKTPLPTKAPEPTKTPAPQVGEFWMESPMKPVAKGSLFIVKIRINTGDQKIAAYGIHITFDPSVIDVDTNKGSNGVEPGTDGFVAAANPTTPGNLFVAGFDVYGKGPGDNLHIVTIHWKAVDKGTSSIDIEVKNLVDEKVAVIGVKKGISAMVEVQ